MSISTPARLSAHRSRAKNVLIRPGNSAVKTARRMVVIRTDAARRDGGRRSEMTTGPVVEDKETPRPQPPVAAGLKRGPSRRDFAPIKVRIERRREIAQARRDAWRQWTAHPLFP